MGIPFLDALAQHCLDHWGSKPLDLADVVILLPNRRSVSALSEAFLRRSEGKALLLPSIRAMGDWDDPDGFTSVPGGLDLPPAISAQRRLFLLRQMIQHWSDRSGFSVPESQIPDLARALARLIDALHTEGVPAARLHDLVETDMAQHWQLSLDFLTIIIEQWPKLLAELGLIDPAARRDRLIRVQADKWRKDPPAHPVIAAGSTGTVPATAALIRTVMGLPQGLVLLPGLDREMADEGWAQLAPSHPQYALKALLTHLGVDRADVAPFPAPSPALNVTQRTHLMRRALDPPVLAAQWRNLGASLANVQRLDLPSRREEAAYIALRMAEVAQTPARTAALVTPDRLLAQGVAAELRRWNLVVDDSAGVPLKQTEPGRFVRLLLHALEADLAPVPLLALMKHHLFAPEGDRPTARAFAQRLELAALRGVRPAPGAAGLRLAAKRMDAQDRALLDRLLNTMAGLKQALKPDPAPLADLIDRHFTLAQTLAGDAAALWQGEVGRTLSQWAAEWHQAAAEDGVTIDGMAYARLFEALMDDPDAVVRQAFGGHPRLAIRGPMEARLQQADLVILGGLNEGAWPAQPAHDPWMSAPMRTRLGLPPVDRRTGQSAHDFLSAAAAADVVLTRSEKVDGAPTVPSRWLTRLQALGAMPQKDPRLDWMKAVEQPEHVKPCDPPRPAPPVHARPRSLSVTRIERLMRDPYGVYSEKILRLRPLDPLEQEVHAAQKGEVIHKALELFFHDLDGAWPDDPWPQMHAAGIRAFAPLADRPAVRTFWWPRFLAIGRAIILEEQERRAQGIVPVLLEVRGDWRLPSDFIISAKADRMDRHPDGRIEIIDYKTGSVPTFKRIKAGYAPQLPLEGIMVEEGAFFDGARPAVADLAHWKLGGGQKQLDKKPIPDPQDRMAQARAMLDTLLAHYARENTAYLSQPVPDFADPFGDYDHLARQKEWSNQADFISKDSPWPG